MSLMSVSAGPSQGHTFVYDACQDMNTSSIAVHWVSNVDGWVLVNLLSKLSASTTLVIVSSKSFGTAETLLNAETIRNWFIQQGIEGEELCKHFVVVSSNEKAGEKSGCLAQDVSLSGIGSADSFSVWSATGLPLMIAFRSDTLMNSFAVRIKWICIPLKANLKRTCLFNFGFTQYLELYCVKCRDLMLPSL